MARIGVSRLPLDEARMQFDLIDRRQYPRPLDQVLQVLRAKVGDADGAHAPLGEQLLGRLERGDGGLEIRRDRPMEKIEVEVLQAKLAEACLAGPKRPLVAVVADPQFGGDEKLGARDPAALDAFANLPLDRIGGGRVDKPVTRSYRGFNSTCNPLRFSAVQGAEAEGRHLDAVVQGE